MTVLLHGILYVSIFDHIKQSFLFVYRTDTTDSHAQDYCLQDETHVQRLLDVLFDPHQSLPGTIQKHLSTIKSCLSGGQPFEEFCNEGRLIFR